MAGGSFHFVRRFAGIFEGNYERYVAGAPDEMDNRVFDVRRFIAGAFVCDRFDGPKERIVMIFGITYASDVHAARRRRTPFARSGSDD